MTNTVDNSGTKEYEAFIDLAKIIACVLVVIGHLVQSLVKANIMEASDTFYKANQLLYYFHVQIFFVCSGYLYQKHSKVNSFDSWKKNAKKKIINLGIPYVFFTTVSWILKEVFSSQVNQQNSGGLLEVLFLNPMAPYWYLITLILIFILVPTINRKRDAYLYIIINVLFLLIKNIVFQQIEIEINIIIAKVLEYALYFILGMIIEYSDIIKVLNRINWIFIPVMLLLLDIYLGLQMHNIGIISIWPIFVIWGMGMVGIILWICVVISEKITNTNTIKRIGEYVYPIFLMHTLITAPVRLLLVKIGNNNSYIHIIVGICASIIGPIIVYEIMKKMKWPLFVLYPSKIKNV